MRTLLTILALVSALFLAGFSSARAESAEEKAVLQLKTELEQVAARERLKLAAAQQPSIRVVKPIRFGPDNKPVEDPQPALKEVKTVAIRTMTPNLEPRVKHLEKRVSRLEENKKRKQSHHPRFTPPGMPSGTLRLTANGQPCTFRRVQAPKGQITEQEAIGIPCPDSGVLVAGVRETVKKGGMEFTVKSVTPSRRGQMRKVPVEVRIKKRGYDLQ